MIYFAEVLEGGSVEPGTIKIGFSGRVPVRLLQLEVGYGWKVKLLGVMAGDRDMEAVTHELFAEERIDRRELFRPSVRLMGYIRENARRWTEELDGDGDFDRTLNVIFSGEEVTWLRALAVEAGFDVTAEGCTKAISRALHLFAEFLGVPHYGERPPLPPDQLPLAADHEYLEGVYDP